MKILKIRYSFTENKQGFRGLCAVYLSFVGLSVVAGAQLPVAATGTTVEASAVAFSASTTSVLVADSVAGPGGPGSSADAVGGSSSSLPNASLPTAPLPDAPQPQLHRLTIPPAPPGTGQHVAPIYASTIPAGYRAQPLTVHDKVVLGARDLYSFESLAGIALSAGYSHITDGQPNYGVNSKAFAQRLGAAAARQISEGVFSEIVLAPLLHEDPRYYVMGPSANPVKRALYAITRPLLTKTDSGKTTVNAALLIGYAGATALTSTYYPQSNRNFHDGASTFGASIGGAALGDFVSEFSDDVLIALHLKRLP